MTRVKLCGLRTREDVSAAGALRPDYAGFILSPGFRRSVTAETVLRLRPLLPPETTVVGVVVDMPPAQAAALVETGVIDRLQLHGSETAEDIRRLQDKTGKPLFRAFRIRTAADLLAAEASPADTLLLDSGAGTGKTFDWFLLRGFSRPFLLAGGLSPENVAAAIAQLHPFGVDVSSGVETDGKKDPEKMRAFVRAARQQPET